MSNTILIVEDRADSRDMIAFALKQEGYNVLEAEDGKKAVEMVEVKNIDIILLDLLLPKLSGEEVLKEIRKNKKNNKSKIIILTASKLSETAIANFRKKGADGFLLKPINIKEILEKIREMLGGKG